MAMLDTARQNLVPGTNRFDSVKLDPHYLYLRVSFPAGVTGLLLGVIETTSVGPVEVWYASDGEVVRLLNGRLAGNTGLSPEWRGVVLPEFPSWRTLAESNAPFHWQRVRDLMPGYRYDMRDQLVLTVVPAPRSSRLVGIDPAQLVWFEERMESSTGEILPPARYAVQGDRVIYAEQCLSPERCFTWQRWPVGS